MVELLLFVAKWTGVQVYDPETLFLNFSTQLGAFCGELWQRNNNTWTSVHQLELTWRSLHDLIYSIGAFLSIRYFRGGRRPVVTR